MELHTWPKHAVPRDIAIQIRSFLRIQWPFLMGRANRIYDVPERTDGPTTIALIDGDVLVSHAEINFRAIDFESQPLKVGGISAVFTYPAFRSSGFANQVVTAATQMILESDADLAMLFCGEPLQDFYASCGWSAMKTAHVMFGDPEHPTLKDDNVVMMLFVSERGKQLKALLERETIYVGASTW
jgi:predicted acetyltransferase